MASVEKLSEKLSKILQKNIDEKKGCAIAIAGEWGIGKTYFWNYFKDNFLKDKNEKIAYISLFGIESLDSLKYEIGIKTHSSDISDRDKKSNDKVKNFFTGLLSHIKVPDLESNGITLSIGQNLITNMIGGMVKDTIICIDDLERKSDKLDLKDVMGLVNQLKLEKNCQVIVILHEDKADKQYQEYKEKVFDDVFYLTENFEIIKEIIDNNEVIHIYQDFYDKLQVKNIRFYERVNKDYNEIVNLIDDLTITSKEHILRNLLMIRFADQFPKKFEFENEQSNFVFNLDFISNFKMGDFTDTELTDRIDKLNDFFKGFIYFYDMDNWVKIIANNIINHDIDNDLFLELVEQDKISEQKVQAKIYYDELVGELHNLNTKPDFLNRFYQGAMGIIGNENFNNLSFCYQVISIANQELADHFKCNVESYIKEIIKNQPRKPNFNDFYFFNVADYDIFSEIIRSEIDNYQPKFDLCEFFINYDRYTEYDDFVKDKVRNITKDELGDIIWLEIDSMDSRKNFLHLILDIPYFSDEKREQVRQWIIELLQEKAEKNPDSELAIKFWLTHTENLTKF